MSDLISPFPPFPRNIPSKLLSLFLSSEQGEFQP